MKTSVFICLAAILMCLCNLVTSQTATNVTVLDTRGDNASPSSYAREAKFEFKARGSIGVPGDGYYSGLLTFAPWGDNSGNKVHQLNFNEGGLYWRTGQQGGSWDSWLRLVVEDPDGKINARFYKDFPAIRGTFGHYGNAGGLSIISQGSNNTTLGSGDIRFITSTSNSSSSSVDAPTNLRMIIKYNGNIGIGTSSPSNIQGWDRVLDVNGSSNSKIIATSNSESYRTGIYAHSSWHGGGGFIGTESNHNLFLITGYSPKLTILTNGNVLVGKTTQINSEFKFDVDGKIRANEIVVNTTGADFVFEPTYKLRSLNELETFIKENKHLPDIVPAKEMQENGVSSGEMHAKLLQKVEELTLYIIELEKRVNSLESQKPIK